MDSAAATSALTGYWRQLRKPLELELARGCPDTAIQGMSIGAYTRAWAERLSDDAGDDRHFALSLARGLRDYAAMSPVERRRRVMAAIDLLRGREEQVELPAAQTIKPVHASASTAKSTRAPASKASRAPAAPLPLPVGHELLEMPLAQLALRARWPRLLADNLHLYTVRDLLYHVPREWVEIYAPRDLPDGARAAMVGTVTLREYERLRTKNAPHPLYKYTLTLSGGDCEIWVTSITTDSDRGRGKKAWSLPRLPFQPGQTVFAMGKVERVGRLIELHMEDIYQVNEAEAAGLQPGARVPLYPLTAGVYQSQVQRAVLRILASLGSDESANALIDPLPEHIREQYALLPLVDALLELHRPRNPMRHEQARKRLAFEEFLIPQLILARRRWEQHHTAHAQALVPPMRLADLLARIGPFEPTAAQRRVLGEIEDDLRSPRPMNRLLQGDVGSGKTLVAAGALAFAARAGSQAAIMAPTEILAEQLYLVLGRLLAPLGVRAHLLTGSVTGAARRTALAALADGSAAVAVGTHALIQDGVAFRNLGLAIIDEQHRFGVEQRALLRGKGNAPHTLVMTATPIPRTLALGMYGDLDMSVLDELPPGRRPVETCWVPTVDLPEAYAFIREQIAAGRQAYVLCPLVEESDLLQADAAVTLADELQRNIFPELRIGLLHGRMRPEEKDAAMEAFRAGQTHLLACTTVVEVGVDVPNASVMLINNAERFGLSQLHQLRGRVGRAQHQSYCLLVTHPRFNPEEEGLEDTKTRRRLRTLLHEQDGFAIAEADLDIRGPGEYLGTRQSGLLDFHIGNLLRDGLYLEHARQAAHAIIADDPNLATPAHAELRRRVNHLKATVDQFRE